MCHHDWRMRLHIGLILTAVVLAGCRKDMNKLPQTKAEIALDRALDAWARGESPEKLADPTQPIQLIDPDWKAGFRLLSFLNVDTKPSGDNPNQFRCRVSLNLKDPKGKQFEKEVAYTVQVGENTTISRETP